MKPLLTRSRPNTPAPRLSGVTLSEVLISMLIMGIGVASVATVFPASILRAIQASQLTNAAILSKNATARLEYDTTILSNSNTNGFSPATYDPAAMPTAGAIDPYGIWNGLPNTIGGTLGRYSGYAGGALSKVALENMALLPDSWSLVREDTVDRTTPYAAGDQSIKLSAPANDFSNIVPRNAANLTNPLYRIILINATGRKVFRRTIRDRTGNLISWLDPSPGSTSEPALNLFSTLDTPIRARIEVREPRYTWMLTVRKRAKDSSNTSWTGDTALAVFFNRSFLATDEQSLSMNTPVAPGGMDGQPGFAGVDDDLNGYTDYNTSTSSADATEYNWPGSDDNRTLTYAGSLPITVKKGGYLLDVSTGLWYRIVKLDTSVSTSTRILVDRNLKGQAPYAMVTFKGIVQVFELGALSGS